VVSFRTEPEVLDEGVTGKWREWRRDCLALGRVTVALMFSFSVRAELTPEASTVDSRIRTVAFDPREVYRLYAHVAMRSSWYSKTGRRGPAAGGDLEAITLGGTTII